MSLLDRPVVGRPAGEPESRDALRDPAAGATLNMDAFGRIKLPRHLQGEYYLLPNRQRTMLRLFYPDAFMMVAKWVESHTAVSPKDRAIFLRHFFGGAPCVATDMFGRITIPLELRQELDLQGEVRLRRGTELAMELFSPRIYDGSSSQGDASAVTKRKPTSMTPPNTESGGSAPHSQPVGNPPATPPPEATEDAKPKTTTESPDGTKTTTENSPPAKEGK